MFEQTDNGSAHEQSKPRILVVDDNDEVRQLLESCLNESGFRVISANNGYAAKDRLNRECFDLVITDICMPGLTGNVLLQHIRILHRHLPTIAVTASPELAHNNFDLVVRKPFDINALVASIQSLLIAYPAITQQLNSEKMKLFKMLQEIEYGHQSY